MKKRKVPVPSSPEIGSVLPLMAVAMTAMIGVMGLSLDVGNVIVAKGELRNAADAAALAGAAALSMPWVLVAGQQQPNFKLAESYASTALQNLKNTSNNHYVVSGTVTAGGLDLAGGGGSALKPWSNNLLPAVRVELQKDGANGRVYSLFAQALPKKIEYFTPVVVSTVVGGYSPQTAYPGQILPIAIPTGVYNNFWGSFLQQPKSATSSTDKLCVKANNQNLTCQNQASGAAYNIPLGDANGIFNKQGTLVCPPQMAWTVFGDSNPSASAVKNLLADPPVGNPSVSVGEVVNAHGTQAGDFTHVIPSGKTTRVGLVPVVDQLTAGTQKVIAFGCVEITESGKGNAQYMVLNLLPRSDPRCPIAGTGASSSPYVRIPPQIVQ